MCVCVCVRERERERDDVKWKMILIKYGKRKKIRNNREKIQNYGEIIRFMEIQSFITLKNMKNGKNFRFYDSFITLKYYKNTGKVSVKRKYEKSEFYKLEARLL